jgi:hypothetical protein
MAHQSSWAEIEVVIQSVIATAAAAGPGALASSAVIWSHQNADAPPQSYLRISLGAAITVGVDFTTETLLPDWTALTAYLVGDRVLNDSGKTYRCTTAGTSAAAVGPTGSGATIADGSVVWTFVAPGSEIAVTLAGVREVPLVIEGFTTAVVDQAAQATARAIVDDVVSRLRLPTLRETLAAVGVTPFDPGGTTWIPDVVSIGFRGRALCEVRCRMPARAVAEYAGYITSISSTITALGAAGGTLTVPFTAP